MTGFAAWPRRRAVALREIAAYLVPHLSRARLRAIVGTTLALGAAALGLVFTLLMGSLLEMVHGGITAMPGKIGRTELLGGVSRESASGRLADSRLASTRVQSRGD